MTSGGAESYGGGAESRGGVPRGWNGGLASPTMEEHFYPFLLERRPSYLGEEGEECEEEDMSLALERKDKDLLLAAELGKALLERNDQLQRGREALEEELRETQERLEQEKHDLRLKMEVRDSEWRAQVADLENDLTEARLQMRQLLSEQRECGRETASAVQELSEQNQRLLEQIAQASQVEQSLTMELQILREENRELTLSRGQFTPCLQSLQSENALLLEQKTELESQMRQLREESESAQNMVFTLKESALQLKRQKSESEVKVQQLQLETQELRDSQRRLQIQVEERSAGIPGPSAAHMQTYLSEREGDLLREREEEVTRLQDQVTLQYVELSALREELQRLRDLSQQNNPENVLRQAVSDRDEAIMKKGELELELARCHLEKESLSRQLLSAVQQKVQLSQELEAWQDDMQIVISQQLKSQKQQDTDRISETSPTTLMRRDRGGRPRDGGIFSFFRRI
ncbi:BICD family-like cargo adapter 2 isoform 2-T2 [Rhinophrynus dorsalis]